MRAKLCTCTHTRRAACCREYSTLGRLDCGLRVGPRLHVRHDLRLGHHPVDQRQEERVAVDNRGGDAVQIVPEPVEAGDDRDIADGELQTENEHSATIEEQIGEAKRQSWRKM